MDRAGLDAEKLAHEDHDAEAIARLRETGVIVADDGPDSDETAYLYVRHRRGVGTSDDACIVLCGLLHGFSAGVGAFLADAVDTLEKYVPVFGGRDGALAGRIEREWATVSGSAAKTSRTWPTCAPTNAKTSRTRRCGTCCRSTGATTSAPPRRTCCSS
jgi:hypothetical protein